MLEQFRFRIRGFHNGSKFINSTYESSARNYAYPLIDLCWLIYAIVLHDQLYTLPRQMNPKTADMELRSSLLASREASYLTRRLRCVSPVVRTAIR